jgi:hypothetical protein
MACEWPALVTNTADLAILHLLRWSLPRWFLVAEVLKVGVLRHHLLLLDSALIALHLFYSIIEFVTGIVCDLALLFLLRRLWRIDLRWQVRLQRCRFGWARGLPIYHHGTDTKKSSKQGPLHRTKIQNTRPKRLGAGLESVPDMALVAEPHFVRRAAFWLLFMAKIGGI